MSRRPRLFALLLITALSLGLSVPAVTAQPTPQRLPAAQHLSQRSLPVSQSQSVLTIPFQEGVKDKPYQRWLYSYALRAFPADDIPAGARNTALQQTQAARARQQTGPAGAQAVDAITGYWTNIGPAPQLGGQIGRTTGARPVSGRIASLAVDPNNNSRWLAGAAAGGIWETRNAGETWMPRTDDQPSLAIGALAFAPSNTNIIYAGTGEGAFSLDSYFGQGMLKSTNGGTTWTTLATSTFNKTSFRAIRVNPANPDVLMAATVTGNAGREVLPIPNVPATGVFKSTNGGVSWTKTLPVTGSGHATSLVVNPNNFNQQYAALGNRSGDTVNNGVYRSTTAGDTWTMVTGPWSTGPNGVGRIELAIAPSDPNVVYVSIMTRFGNPGPKPAGGLLGLYKTTNAWAGTPSWTQINAGATDNGTGDHGYCGWDAAFGSASNQCWYSHVIGVDPSNPNVLYAGGVPLWRYNGTTWSEVSNTANDPFNGIHVDQHSMAWAGDRLVVGNDGGVWSSIDDGATWDNHNTNLSLTQFYDGAVHFSNPNVVVGGAQDNGSSGLGSSGWRLVTGGDGADNAVSTNLAWATSFQNLALFRTLDGGMTTQFAGNGINTSGAPFIARIAMCPDNNNIMIAGTRQVWRSSNFFVASQTPQFQQWSNLPWNVEITAMRFAPNSNCAMFGYGFKDGTLVYLEPGDNNYYLLDDFNVNGVFNNQVPDRAVTAIAFDPTDPQLDTVYVTLSGFDENTPGKPGHVFKTTNARANVPTWTNISPPVNIPFNALALDPNNPQIVIAGSDLGVWISENGGADWKHMGPEVGMPNVAVFDVEARAGTYFAFTHGRGAFRFVSTSVATIRGNVSLQGRTSSSLGGAGYGAGFSMVTVSLESGGQVNADADGNFTITGAPPGANTITACAPGYVCARRNITVVDGVVLGGLPPIQLGPGLVNTTDSMVTITDITALIAVFGQSTGNRQIGGNWVDLNGDGVVNLRDLTLALGNFGKASPVDW